MPRESQREVLADRQDAAQPALFDDSLVPLPVESAALESIRQRRYEFKGVRLVEDDAKALRLVELLCLKWGVKRISAEMHVSCHTVRAARRLLVAQGKLAPYKQRVVEAMEDAIEAGVERYRDALESGTISAAQIPIGMGIMFDKRALSMWEPTSIRGVGEVQSDELKVETINAFFDKLPVARVTETGAATDSASGGNAAIPQQIEGNPPLDVTLDATPTRPEASPERPTPEPSTRPDAGRTGTADGDPARPGGGGGLDGSAVD